MTDSRRLSICIPTFERVELTMESFANVYHDERVSEIVIVDDASSNETFFRLKALCDALPKVKLFRNVFNRDCALNKNTAVSFAQNEFVILLDSDNSIGDDYIDKIYEFESWKDDTILTPEFAMPHFDFTAYTGILWSKENIAKYIDRPMAETCLNAANFFVNRDRYCQNFDTRIDPVTSDSIYFCYNWLNGGGKIQVVEGMRYQHKVWEGSHYRSNIHRTPVGFHESILQKIRQLK